MYQVQPLLVQRIAKSTIICSTSQTGSRTWNEGNAISARGGVMGSWAMACQRPTQNCDQKETVEKVDSSGLEVSFSMTQISQFQSCMVQSALVEGLYDRGALETPGSATSVTGDAFHGTWDLTGTFKANSGGFHFAERSEPKILGRN